MVKEQPHEGEYSNGQWVEINEYQASHAPSPAHEFNNFNFVHSSHHGLPVDPYSRPIHSFYSAPHQQQPIYPAQWPSMLTNPSTHAPSQPPPPPPPPPTVPVSSFASTHSLPPITTQPPPPSQPTARRTLTDQDRRRMCQYHEDNPSVKQTEIGGVRSRSCLHEKVLLTLFPSHVRR